MIVLFVLFLIIYFLKYTPLKKIVYPLSIYRDREIHMMISEYLPPQPCKILNFGAGLNTYGEFLTFLGYDVTSLDIVDQSISTAPVTVYDGDPSNIPDEQYGAVIISTVLHHIPSDIHLEILQELKKRTNTIIVIEDHMDDNIWSYLKTSASCALFNMNFINRHYEFKPADEWIKLFQLINPKNIKHIFDKYDIFILHLS